MLYPCAIKFYQKLFVHLHEANSHFLDPRQIFKNNFRPKNMFSGPHFGHNLWNTWKLVNFSWHEKRLWKCVEKKSSYVFMTWEKTVKYTLGCPTSHDMHQITPSTNMSFQYIEKVFLQRFLFSRHVPKIQRISKFIEEKWSKRAFQLFIRPNRNHRL
jgi:hypothetical protein